MKKHRTKTLLILVFSLIFFANPLLANGWEYYTPSSLLKFEELAKITPNDTTEIKPDLAINPGDRFTTSVVYLGKVRKLEDQKETFFMFWFKAFKLNRINIAHEVLVSEGKKQYWIPIQEVLFSDFVKEISEGNHVTLFVVYTGAIKQDAVFIMNEFKAEIYSQGNNIPAGELRRVGADLVCGGHKKYPPCLKIGGVSIGMTMEHAEKNLNLKGYIHSQKDNTIIKVYPINAGKETQDYWLMYFNKNLLTTIQLTGTNSRPGDTFSSISLGDDKKSVLDILGVPFNGIVEVKEITGVRWSYKPHPISIEMVDDRVYSIRISQTE
jgi:hypothetical protein